VFYKRVLDPVGAKAQRDKRALDKLTCPQCRGSMEWRNNKHGPFLICQRYPACKGARDAKGRSSKDRDIFNVDFGR
jgi:ssDNA-binding Zn-finger/Zn-ribbon topoisomerase 1